MLMNLLNGLAVSDTAVIREKAEIVTYIIRVETISCFEAVLLGDPFNFLANWPAIKLLQGLLEFRSKVKHKHNESFFSVLQISIQSKSFFYLN